MTNEHVPDLLTGTEVALIAQVGSAGNSDGSQRWQQVHFNIDVTRQFFNLLPGDDRSITLERISSEGRIAERVTKRLVFSVRNKNPKIEFYFGPPSLPYPLVDRPLLVVVESRYHTYRYRTLMPGQDGHSDITQLLMAGASVGRGLRRRIVTLDQVEAAWPNALLRGAF